MSTAKKVLAIIGSIIVIGVFAFVLTWGIINWSKVKEGMSGNGLYTQDDIQNAYEDGYSTALTDKEEYDKLINSYRDTITTQNDLISQYTSEATALNNSIKDYQGQIVTLNEQKTALETQIDTLNTIKTSNEITISELNEQIATLSNQVLILQANKNENENQINALNSQIANLQYLNTQLQETNELNVKTINGLNAQIVSLNNQISDLTLQMQNNSSTINALNNKIAELQKSVSYYEQYIGTLESGEQVVATFEFDGSVYNIQVVNKNSILTVTQPTSTAYVIFNGWTVNGEPIDLATFRITANTRIVADVTHKYEVNFMVEGENYNSQIVLKDTKATIPTNPTKNGYVFDGWTLDGNTVINLANYTITQNTTFTAKFTKLYSVIFKYEDATLKTETVKSGNYATEPNATSTTYKVFNGWKVNGVTVSVSEYRITADTVFIADITYKYDVKFMVDGTVYNSQIVEKHAKPTVPSDPTKANHIFVGWSVDEINTVDVSNHIVTENVTFTAIFRIKSYTVTFKNGDTTLSTQTVEHGKYATVPTAPTQTGYDFDGWTVNGVDLVNDISTTAVVADTTYKAKFTKLYTIKFIVGEETISIQTIRNGATVTLPDNPTKIGFRFNGWTMNGIDVIGNVATTPVTQDITYIAKFTGNSFADSSWADISLISKYISANNMTSADVKEVYGWKIGDEKTVRLSTGEVITILIIGFNHDNLSDGSGKAGISFGMKDCLSAHHRMNNYNSTYGSWEASEMRTSTLAEIFTQLPADLQAAIKSVDKKTTAGMNSQDIITTSDKLWLFSEVEIDNASSNEGEQYEYWRTVKDGTVAADRIKYCNDKAATWWLRSPVFVFYECYGSFGINGNKEALGAANISLYISFGFCV